jgi:hypothetical protein
MIELRPALPFALALLGCGDVRPATGLGDVTGQADSNADDDGGTAASGSSPGDDDAAGDDIGPTGTSAGSTGHDDIVFDLGAMPDGPQLCTLPTPRSCDGDSTDPFHAIGLGCPDDAIPIHDEVFAADDDRAWAVVQSYGGPAWTPREGARMLAISTGVLAEPDAGGLVTLPAGFPQQGPNGTGGNSNFNGDAKPLPAPIQHEDGSNGGAGGIPFVDCDGVHDCSGSLAQQWELGGAEANDLLWFSFTTEVPSEATGFSIAFAYFSAEFPEWVGSPYNDMFVLWSQSEAYIGNLCFVGSDPCTVTALWPAPYPEDAPELAGTGFEGVGASTGWYVARGAVLPGEEVTLTFALFDMHDRILDTTVLLDDFQWECEGCNPNARDCGIDPQG